MRRREFLSRSGKAALAAAGSAGAGWLLARRDGEHDLAQADILKDFSIPADPSLPDLAIVRGAQPDAMVRKALERLGGMERFVSKGDVVLVKPNAAFDRPPALGATTSPEVVEAVVRLCIESGAAEVLVADNPINSPERCFERSGIEEAVVRAGGKIVWPTASQFEEADLQGWVLGRWPLFASPLRLANKLIGIPTAKEHNLCGASLAMKNWYGFLGEGRNRLHQNIHEAIVDLAQAFPSTLVVLDATRLLMRNGPTGGSASDVTPGQVLCAGTDVVAVDAFGAELLGQTEACAYLGLAAERGLGQKDWRKTKVEEVSL